MSAFEHFQPQDNNSNRKRDLKWWMGLKVALSSGALAFRVDQAETENFEKMTPAT